MDRKSDDEMLRDCLDAFEAVTTAFASKKLLKQWNVKDPPYSGNAMYRLAKFMQGKLRDHLGRKGEADDQT
jgi:hypothetical protein